MTRVIIDVIPCGSTTWRGVVRSGDGRVVMTTSDVYSFSESALAAARALIAGLPWIWRLARANETFPTEDAS